MKKKLLEQKTSELKNETAAALKTILDALNQGQRKKVTQVPEVKALLERYGVSA